MSGSFFDEARSHNQRILWPPLPAYHPWLCYMLACSIAIIVQMYYCSTRKLYKWLLNRAIRHMHICERSRRHVCVRSPSRCMSGSFFDEARSHNQRILWPPLPAELELELELIQTQMAQKPMLRAEVGMRVRCANKASAE